MKTQYYQIKSEHREYKGTRLFRVSFVDDIVTQICLSSGYVKRGKSNTFGIYLISKQGFFSDYFGYYVEPITKKKFDTIFNKTVTFLK